MSYYIEYFEGNVLKSDPNTYYEIHRAQQRACELLVEGKSQVDIIRSDGKTMDVFYNNTEEENKAR